MSGKLQFDLAAYQEAAHKYRPELLMLPIIGIKDTRHSNCHSKLHYRIAPK